MQDIAAILIVALAVGFLSHRGWQHFARRQAGRCTSCSACTASVSVPTKPLLNIAPVESHAKSPRRKEVSS